MAVNRYNGSRYNVSGNHTDFPLWLFLSVAIHLVPAIVVLFTPRVPQIVFRPPVYQVELLTRPETVKTEEAPKKEELIPSEGPRVEVKVKDTKHKAIKKAKRSPVTLKHKEDAAKPDDAIAKMREKFAAEDAVERVRKRVREKETASNREVKVAARPPAKVYHYEELDDEMKAYYATISQIIRNAWSLPDVLRNKGYKAVLAIHVLRDGTVKSLWIEEKSGNSFYDETTVRAINKVTTLPPLPKGWKEGPIDLGFNF